MEGNAAFIAMTGPARALNTIGGQVTWQSTAFGAICAGLMSMFIIGRHTRAEEESGRDELVRAAAIGRQAPMTAAVARRDARQRRARRFRRPQPGRRTRSRPRTRSRSVSGLTLAAWVFTGTALIAAQLTASTRSMYGIAGAVIGVAYVLRAVGDVGASALSWLSPIGWYQGMHAFSGLRWWPALLLLAGSRGRDVRGVRRVRSVATSAPASWRPGRARPRGALGCAARSAWPGTSSARR